MNTPSFNEAQISQHLLRLIAETEVVGFKEGKIDKLWERKKTNDAGFANDKEFESK